MYIKWIVCNHGGTPESLEEDLKEFYENDLDFLLSDQEISVLEESYEYGRDSCGGFGAQKIEIPLEIMGDPQNIREAIEGMKRALACAQRLANALNTAKFSFE